MILLVLLGILVGLQARSLLRSNVSVGVFGKDTRGSAGRTQAGADDVEWNALVRLTDNVPRAGSRDIFSPAEELPVRVAKPKTPSASDSPRPEPLPEVIVPPPPPPPEDPLVQLRKDFASYRFAGHFSRTAGDRIVFLARGNDVLLVRRGDVLASGVVVTEVKEGEIHFLFPPNRKIWSVLKDNTPLAVR